MSVGLSTPGVAYSSVGALRRLIGPAVVPDRFLLSHGMNLVRIMAGLLYAPHVYQKLTSMDFTLGFFTKAGLVPAPIFVGLALVFETLSMVGLIFGLYTRWIGLVSAGCMVVAAYAILQVNGAGWYWAKGGIEYLVFWGIASLAISIDAFNERVLRASP